MVAASFRESPAPVPHDPAVSGVVATRDFLGPRTVRLVLVTGETLEIDLKTNRNLNPNLDEPDPGELLMYGTEPDGRSWFATALPSMETDGVFDLWSQSRGMIDGSFTFESGLRLPIADDFSFWPTGHLEAEMPTRYLLNEQGEVERAY